MSEQTYRRDAMEKPPLVDVCGQPGQLIRRAQQVHTYLWATSVSSEVTSTQFAMLSAIAERPSIDQNSLSRQVSVDTSTVAEVVNRLVDRGHVTRGKDPADRRRNLLSLSESGHRMYAEVSAAAAAMTDRLVATLPEHDRGELVRILRNLVESGEAMRDADAADAQEARGRNSR
ncbi:MarR family winged helix-turn-helix transcriptional regulator [Streptomyces jumonjinensis]|uniref:Winged helix-turn-helix transcriptional regulator n=1 Tax=Streptomyces jumonjinensis TaxID=1945 RepID=A0A646KCW6_STRJU|nr:MarR family winged helix-turn-helix transcriptional regulator [Streptomyces jumonjinensis]MQT00139.1 winged helix-turn-helix transcriptional regulator [Streptomyces jumonjinensis]